MVVRKMPCLRSQTRGSSTTTTSLKSADSKFSKSSVVSPLPDTMSSIPATTSNRLKSNKSTAFPFPSISEVTQAKTPSIIDITNASSEASLNSDLSHVSSVQSTTVSSDCSSDKSENLDAAMLQNSLDESNLFKPVDDPLPIREPDFDPTLAKPSEFSSNLSSLLRQPLISSPLVYIPVLEQPSVHKSGDKALQMTLVDHECYEFESGMNLRKKIVNELDMLVKQWVHKSGDKALQMTLV